MATRDRIAEPWGARTPYERGQHWPDRVDMHLADGVVADSVDRWVPTASVLHSNGDGLDIAVKDGRMVGVRGRANDRINHGRVDPKDLFAGDDGHHRAANELTPTEWDPASKQPIFKTAAAQARRVGPGKSTPAPQTSASSLGGRIAAAQCGVAMKLGLALRELHRSERSLALTLDALAARHHSDHAIQHVATDLAAWSQRHVDEIATVGRGYGLRLRSRSGMSALSAPLQQRLSDLLVRRSEPALLLLADLRRVYRLAAGVSVDWEQLAQAAQAAKDDQLLELARRCHPETLRQVRWANAMIKELSPQTLTS